MPRPTDASAVGTAELGEGLTAATYCNILTAAVALLITSIQTVIISITLPQGSYAALIVALELIVFTSLWLRATTGSFWEK
ncbi:hypothetical protein EYF80_001089 [Liparis tanakae]|uniref:Uncharacterized protein n=1 Tax=Liparis tanakae TaxID=230148 RepID=A0A4Z2JFK4_9TELE|nr:hypothetical protein EYF80_001089 [Liparis tanakae]